MAALSPFANKPHSPLIEAMFFAKLGEVVLMNNLPRWGKALKWTLFSFGHLFLKVVREGFSGVGIIFRSPSVSVFKSSLFRTISHVVRLCPKKKMVWADADFVVAVMANIKTFIKIPVEKLIRQSVRSLFFPIKIHSSITTAHFCANPIPTSVGFLDIRKKSFDRVFVRHGESITTNKNNCQPYFYGFCNARD